MKQQSALVIGGSGFLGSHVADQLSLAGFKTTVFDKTPSQWLAPNQSATIGDVLDFDAVLAAVEGHDYVFNFSALADLNEALNQPVLASKINIEGNINVLEACKTLKVKRLIYASTVYVNSREGGFYRCTKEAAESFVEEYHRRYGLDFSILRYGSLYGPRSGKDNGLKCIVQSAINDGKISYTGNGNAIREYIHVEDAAKASVAILSEEFENETIVLTGLQPTKIFDLLGMLAEILSMDDKNIEFHDSVNVGHYVRTPYSHKSNRGRKYTLPMHVDLGQGLLELVREVEHLNNSNSSVTGR